MKIFDVAKPNHKWAR